MPFSRPNLAAVISLWYYSPFSNTISPAIHVLSIFVFKTSCGEAVIKSASSITKSAYFPGSRLPFSFSSNEAFAAQMVIERSVCSRVRPSSMCQPPSGNPLWSVRKTEEKKVNSGSMFSTGKSVPLGNQPFWSSKVWYAYAPLMRYAPTRFSAHDISDVQWVAWTDGTIENSANFA